MKLIRSGIMFWVQEPTKGGCGFCMADTNIISTVIINNHYIDEFIVFSFKSLKLLGLISR